MDENEMIEEIEIVKYSLALAEDNRILHATFEQFNPNGVIVEELPEGDITDYLYKDGEYIYSPLPKVEPTIEPTQLDIIEAQVMYTALMTDTLIDYEGE